ncbi:MAG TPA: GNAT family N-acetyltransferase [Roseiflexaceae bacterium]|nr:GNAT family N-acetyltransferase [Roseiflexaceae bacterium]
MIDIRPYREQEDAAAVYALWQTALGRQWPIGAGDFHKLLTDFPQYQAGDYFVASENDQIVGFVAAQIDRSNLAFSGIAALFVDPQFQRRGIGTRLHQAALERLREIGAGMVQLGCGGYSYFWPGVPDNLPAAKLFFEACGWRFEAPCYDLAQPMQGYRSPHDLATDTIIGLATPGDATALLEFERREFPHWLGAFQPTIEIGDFHELLLARKPTNRAIVGSLILYSPLAHPSRFDGIWKAMLGEPLSEIGCVGVAEAEQGRGIGTAMVARASEILQQRGAAAVHIGWVYRVDFYGRLGYAKWQAFHMSSRSL